MVKVTNTEAKMSSAKRTITIKDAIVEKLSFYDETGNVTSQVLEQIPDDIKTIDIKIVLTLSEDNDFSDSE